LADATGPATYSLTARQAAEVSAAVRFIAAFNQRSMRLALALLAQDVAISDCDYRHVRTIEFIGRTAAKTWLQQRFRDRDNLDIGQVFNDNPAQLTGGLGIDYARRTSKTLRALGFPRGFKPRLVTKVAFTPSKPIRIRTFALGALGGPPELCRAGN
jgi:hypothetical protein